VAPEERSEDILLFAYVDGELDEDQRRLVEELLAPDPDARRRVEAIRTSIGRPITAPRCC
jgi:anti-sigma factor RsiW